MRVNKIDAARRQIDAAVRMLFDGEDPVAIHTLAAAGGRIVRDLCERRGTPLHSQIKAMLVPGKEAEFWRLINEPANFFKHADRDADEILDNVDERVNDLMLFDASLHYEDLGYARTPEMRTIVAFASVMYPGILNLDAVPGMKGLVEQLRPGLTELPRHEQLTFGKRALAEARQR